MQKLAQWYACTGATEFQGRCRNPAAGESQRCSQHPNTPQAPKPDGVVIRFMVNLNRSQRLEELGVERRPMDWLNREEQEVRQARALGREAYHIRQDKADAGTPVFGKPGLGEVSISRLWAELLRAGYPLSDVYLLARQDNKMDFLWVAMEKGSFSITSPVEQEVLKLVGSTWQYCHVWANPPRGKIRHTVNLLHRQDQSPDTFLEFRDGLWGSS